MLRTDALEPVLNGRREFLELLGSGSQAAQKPGLAFMAAQAAAEERVRQDYTGRYPMELLQNAHDACAEAGRVGRVQFCLSETALLVANEGMPFDEAHIDSLVSLGISEKTTVGGKRKTIGYKGIGFSSVFEISDNPQVITRELAFSFGREQARATVAQALGRRVELVPVRAFPFRIDEADWSDDVDLVAGLFADGAVSVVRLPLRDLAVRLQVAESLRASLPPEVLLFSPAIRSIQITVGDLSTTWRRTSARRHAGGRVVFLEAGDGERRGWLVADGTVRLSRDLVTALDDRLWADVRELSYAVALPWQGGILDSRRPQPLHVYYPTDDVLDRAILVHGDFYVTSDRRRIEVKGPGGKISRLVADAAAATLARLAESVAARQGGQLLLALAPSDGSDGFGHQMGEAIDSALRWAKIARATTGTQRAPNGLAVFDARYLDTSAKQAFAQMFGRQAHLLKITDGDEMTIPFLKKLGSEVLDPEDAAGKIRHMSPAYYGRRCSAIASWLDILVKTNPSSTGRVVRVLRNKPLLVDADGKPVRADEAVLRIADVPPLPSRLQRREVRVPPFASGELLLQRLGIEELNLRAAVKLVLDAVGPSFGRNREEGESVLAFLQAAWQRDRTLVEAQPSIKFVTVPTKKTSGDTIEWIAGRDTYFSSAWTGNDDLERLYGPFQESKFLAVRPKKRGARQQRAFFSALGVAELPIVRRYYDDWPPYGANNLSATWAWHRAIDPNDNGACPDHPRSQSVRFDVVDRLDEILGSNELSIRRATALATLLTAMRVPFGDQATVTCANTTHRRRITRKLVGYQDWLLRTRDWIPTHGLASTGTSLHRPVAAWRDVGRAYASLALPRAVLPQAVSEALSLPSPANPTVEALEYLLADLRRAHPDLSQAGQASRDTARWAQQQLDRSLRRAAPRKLDFHLVAEVDGALVWTKEPLVPDVPGARSIPGLPIVLGRCASLQRVFGLKTAREVLTISVLPFGHVRAVPYLDSNIKTALLAFLETRGADPEKVAARLARLRDRPAQQVTIRVNYGKRRISVDRPVYIEVVRDRREAIRGGTLHWAPRQRQEINTLSLAEELAFYLGDREQAEPLALFLSNPADVLDRYQITDPDLDLAQSALNAAARRTKSADDDQEALRHDEIAPKAPGYEEESPAESPPAPAEPQPSATASPSGDAETVPSTNTSDIRRALHQFERRSTPAAQPAYGDGYSSSWRSAQLSFGSPTGPRGRASATRSRIRSKPADGVGGRRSGAGSTEVDRDAEADAIEIVKQYGRAFGAVDVRDVQDRGLGWDLEFVMADGRLVPVEVKGSLGDTAFMITRNERMAASTPEYLLLWVANLRNQEHAVMRRFSRLGRELIETHLTALSWVVEGWPNLSYDEVPITRSTKGGEAGT